MLKKPALLFLIFISSLSSVFGDSTWLTSIEDAKKAAKAENKLVMIKFSGSDWCPPCIGMDKEVFTKSEFLEEAKKSYILVVIDTPRKDPAKAEMTKQNQKLMTEMNVKGLPFMILMDEEGTEFSRFFPTQHPTVELLNTFLAKQLRRKDMF